MNLLADLLLEMVETVVDWRDLEDEVDEASLPGETDVVDVDEEGGYLVDPDGRIFEVDATAGGHDLYCTKFLDRPLGEVIDSGWLRVVISPHFEQTIYFMGGTVSRVQVSTLKDMAAVMGYKLERDTHTEYR